MFLPVTIMIVTTPARALRQVTFDHTIDHFDRVAHDRIVRTADAEPHEVKKITADHIPRRMETAAIGELDHRCVRIGGKTFRHR